MSKLHSIYAWGVVGMIIFATVFLRFIGQSFWQYLALIFALVPLAAAILYSRVEIPKMETPERVTGAIDMMKKPGVWLCVTLIFLGGASECTMAQWCSGFLEKGLGIEKIWGDVFGAALFALTLGLGRTLYAKYGKSISKVLLCCTCGAVVCYLTAALTENPIVGMLACGFTGLATSMLWPGSLIVASDRFPTAGVFIYAIMAAGGDLGASVGPQLVGLITDAAIEIPSLLSLADKLSLTPDQLGMKLGLLVGMLFPLVAIPFHIYNIKSKKN
jgi:MFS family permease